MQQKQKKQYRKPEVTVVDLAFNMAQMANCHTHTQTQPQSTVPPVPCTLTQCYN